MRGFDLALRFLFLTGPLQGAQSLLGENEVFLGGLGFQCFQSAGSEVRNRTAVKAKELRRKILTKIATIVTPETLSAWHRKQIAQK